MSPARCTNVSIKKNLGFLSTPKKTTTSLKARLEVRPARFTGVDSSKKVGLLRPLGLSRMALENAAAADQLENKAGLMLRSWRFAWRIPYQRNR